MSRNELIAKIEALNEWETLMEEAKSEADAIRSSIKTEMEERGVEELQAGSYIIRWTSVLSNRFDSAAFKRVHDDLYKAFTKQVASRRFSISAWKKPLVCTPTKATDKELHTTHQRSGYSDYTVFAPDFQGGNYHETTDILQSRRRVS